MSAVGIIFIMTALSSFSFVGDRRPDVDPPKTVKYVDVERYVGRWY